MSIDFSDVDLSSVVDEMDSVLNESMRHQEALSEQHNWNRPLQFQKCQSSRVTASGFTESDSETVGSLPIRLTSKQLRDRLKLARDLSGMMNHVELSADQAVYCDDLISRFSNKNADQDPEHIQIQDMKMISTISALGNLKMKEITGEVFSDVHEIKENFKSMIGLGRKKRSDSVVSDSTVLPQARTIMVDDSASQIGPNVNRMTTNRSLASMASTQMSSSKTGISIIGGHQNRLSIIDEDDGLELSPIYGLPIIFVNDRLNFLCHLHKPLKDLLTENGKYPGSDILGKMERFVRRHKGRERDPAANLLYLVIRKTISMERLQVKDNDSFRLPLLKKGMYLTEKLIFMSIDQLHNEFCSEWFATMEDVEVPDFHDKYNFGHSQSVPRRSSASTKKTSRSMLNF